MHEVFWTESALGDLQEVREYIARFNPRAAAKVAGEIIVIAQGLAGFPDRGRPVAGTKLREAVSSYPYIIRYRISGTTVIVLRVRHTARRPTTP